MYLIQAYLDTEETVTYDDVVYHKWYPTQCGYLYIERSDGSEVYIMYEHLVVFAIANQEEKEDE